MEQIIPEAANRFSHGPPLYDATTPMMKPVDIDVIQDGKTSGTSTFDRDGKLE